MKDLSRRWLLVWLVHHCCLASTQGNITRSIERLHVTEAGVLSLVLSLFL
jgi:hypothetical protein